MTPAVPVRKSNSSQMLVGIGRVLHLVTADWGQVGQQPVIKANVPLAEVELDKPGNRFNDGKADKSGRVWIGKCGGVNRPPWLV